jgi:hypothetical protein
MITAAMSGQVIVVAEPAAEGQVSTRLRRLEWAYTYSTSTTAVASFRG